MAKHILQLSTGGFLSPPPGLDESLARLEEAYALLGPQDIIIGWGRANGDNAALYRAVLARAHAAGKKVWLWLPVCSEIPPEMAPAPAIGCNGRPQAGVEVLPGEDFSFICPSTPANLDIPMALYRRYFAGLEFDGVFLDKIRHAAWAGGAENGLGCFCPGCRAAYAAAGVNAAAVIDLWRRDPAAFIPAQRETGGPGYLWANPQVNAFFAAKAGILSRAVARVAEGFRALGLGVGLDVFAPALAPMVGQDLAALARCCDFMKPMFYRITRAPAGLPFELESIAAAFGAAGPAAARQLAALWGGTAQNGGLTGEAATQAQLAAMAALPAANPCPPQCAPGLEINVVPGICDSTPAYVAASQRLLGGEGRATALCWNILAGAAENLKALAAL